MRLRRLAGDDHEIDDVNNGRRHETAFMKIIEKKGTLDESLLLQESYAPGRQGQADAQAPGAIKGLVGSIPTAIRGLRTGKMRSLPKLIPGVHPKLPGDAQEHVKRIYAHAEEHRDGAQPLHHRRGGASRPRTRAPRRPRPGRAGAGRGGDERDERR